MSQRLRAAGRADRLRLLPGGDPLPPPPEGYPAPGRRDFPPPPRRVPRGPGARGWC